MWPAGRSSWGNNPKLLINFHSALTLAFLVLHFLALAAAVPIGRPRSQQDAFYATRNKAECKLATPLVTVVGIFHVCFNIIFHFWNVIIIITSTWKIVLTGDITSGCGIQLWKNRSIVEECGNQSCRRKRKEVILEPIESSGAVRSRLLQYLQSLLREELEIARCTVTSHPSRWAVIANWLIFPEYRPRRVKLILNLDESLRAQNLGNLEREFLRTKYYESTIYYLNKTQLVVSSDDDDNLENIYNHQTSARTIHRPTVLSL